MAIRKDRPYAKRMSKKGGANQADREKSNINSIVANFIAHGTTPQLDATTPLYGDFTTGTDLQDQMDRVNAAQAMYDSLPSEIRKASRNDPAELLEMVGDSDGRELLEDLGLIVVDESEPEAPPSEPSENEPPAEAAKTPPEAVPQGGE